ncbi:MAG TPA: iron-sulfur cluster assembly accessory protein [Planctomycetaceae bacterium]|nr:iron-sulfur cluster assembly accessory protein [Planctomycetaceae bacterium]
MSVTLTEAAAAEIKKIIDEQNKPELKYVRVGIVGGGCSGYQYSFNFTDKFDEVEDFKSDQHGVGVVVDKASELYLDGTTIDFKSDLDKRGFTFDNPNAVTSCGCGSSFSA